MRQSRSNHREVRGRRDFRRVLWRCRAGPRQALPGGDSRTHWSCEPVTAAVLGANELAVRAECLAQRRDLNLQIVLRDDDVPPDTTLQLVLGDERSVGLDQDHEEVESTRAEFYRHAADEQAPLAQQHSEADELERYVSCGRARAMRDDRRAIVVQRLTPRFCDGERWLHDVALLEHTVPRTEPSRIRASDERFLNDFAGRGTGLRYCVARADLSWRANAASRPCGLLLALWAKETVQNEKRLRLNRVERIAAACARHAANSCQDGSCRILQRLTWPVGELRGELRPDSRP